MRNARPWFAVAATLLAGTAWAQPAATAGWQPCTALAAREERLACFDRWAAGQGAQSAPTAPAREPYPGQAERAAAAGPAPVEPLQPATRIVTVATEDGCKDRQYSELSRFWELQSGTDCGTFGLRSYRPISLSAIAADSVNRLPTSGNPANNPEQPQAFGSTEMRVQLSVRTKIAQGLLTAGHPTLKDSLWFGYTQQSYWQLFNGAISRPFRSTDHEPELVYVYPLDQALGGGWKLRLGGLGLVHQSNGQSLPLSRSWNRVYLLAGVEQGFRFRLQGRLWQRLHEPAERDDNPGISNYVGRAEVAGFWTLDDDNTLGLTVRHALKSPGRGSARLEWLQTLGRSANQNSSLRLHAQLFSGYGDSLLDYNRARTVFMLGLSLVDF